MEIRIGLKGLRIAKLTKDMDAIMSPTGKPEVAYEKVISLLDTQKINYTPKIQDASVNADDKTTPITKCTGAEGSIDRTMIAPEEAAMLLNHKVIDGMIVSGEKDEPAEFATGFQCEIYGGKILCQWLLRTKYSEGNFEGESGSDDALNTKSDSISFKALTRKCDKAWRFHEIVDTEEEAAGFFTLDRLQKMATDANASFSQPVDVVFAETLPSSGKAGTIYISNNQGYYWNGTEMTEITEESL